ncbi:hypothetical protein [Stomatohabitans albus]|uniref:hypothetical protein n=1 Tax=Stomatohabitans albus TaxID=3110766 RepID=UPI00300C4837
MKPADQIGSYVTALTLTGLPYATGKLMGKAPQPVLRQFEIWGRAGKSGLPRVVRTYWKAIAPLGINRPSLPGVPILELILYGQMSDVDVARDAHQAVTLGAKRAMHVSGKPAPIDPVVDQMVLEMGTAIKQFWRLYAHTCGKAREQVVNGDLGSAVICVRRNEAQILELIDEIETKARAIVGLVGRTSTAAVDQVLPQLLTPDEYVQPDLEHLVISQVPVDHATPAVGVSSLDAQAQPPGFIESQVHGFPVAPRPEQTAIQTSFEQHDEVDEAAARFATGRMEPITTPEEAPEVGLPPSVAEPAEPPAPYPALVDEPVELDDDGKESGAWLGVIFVLLSVALACAVVWYFMFGSPF